MVKDPSDEPRWIDRIAELRQERKERILELRSEGMKMVDIADALGVSLGLVHKDLTGEDGTTPASTPAAGRAVDVARLRSGSLPESAVEPAEDDSATIADRILGRAHPTWRLR